MRSLSPPPTPAAAAPSPRPAGGANAGFTLIEVLVTALIVILLASATAAALISTSHASGDERLRSQADVLATQDQERLRGLSDEELNGLDQTRTETVDGHSFAVRSTATFLDTTGGSSCAAQAAASYKVASRVSWGEGFSGRTDTFVTEESLLARPVGGDLLTQIDDQTHQPLAGVSVAADGASSELGHSDVNGCVMFAGLSPGAYAITLTDPGYVDPDGHDSPADNTATVTSSGMAKPAGNPFELGLAGSIVGSFQNSKLGLSGEADGISWVGSGATDAMSGPQSTPTASAVTSATTGALFPFDVAQSGPADYTANYTVWGGRCAQQKPPAPKDQVAVTPGSTGAAQSFDQPVLAITGVTYAANPVRPDLVKLTFASLAGTTCTDSWQPTLSQASTPATMPATGWLAYPAQPYANGTSGTLTVCAAYAGRHASVAATNTSFTKANPVATIAISAASPAGAC